MRGLQFVRALLLRTIKHTFRLVRKCGAFGAIPDEDDESRRLN